MITFFSREDLIARKLNIYYLYYDTVIKHGTLFYTQKTTTQVVLYTV